MFHVFLKLNNIGQFTASIYSESFRVRLVDATPKL